MGTFFFFFERIIFALYFTLVSHCNVSTIATPVCVRACVHRCIVLLRPMRFSLFALYFFVFFLDFCQRFGAKLESGIGSIHLEHDVLFADFVAFLFVRRRTGCGRPTGTRHARVNHNGQYGRLFAIAGLVRQIKALLFVRQIGPSANE